MSVQYLFQALNAQVGSQGQKIVLIALADIADENGDCWPSYAYLAKRAECSRRSVINHIAKLSEKGFLTVTHRPRPGDRSATNVYRIRFPDSRAEEPRGVGDKSAPSPPKLDENQPGGLVKILHGVGENSAPDTPIDTITTENPSCSTSKNEPYIETAKAMWTKIQAITKDRREPNFETWAKDIRLMVDRDGRTPEDIWRVFTWANNDDFWQNNILSPGKLRKQFGQLMAKMGAEHARRTQRDQGTGLNDYGYPGAGRRSLTPAERVRANQEAVRRRAAGQSPDVDIVASYE